MKVVKSLSTQKAVSADKVCKCNAAQNVGAAMQNSLQKAK